MVGRFDSTLFRKFGVTATALIMAANMEVIGMAMAPDVLATPESAGSEPSLIQQEGEGYSSITIYDGVSGMEGPQYTGEVETELSDIGKPAGPRYYPFEITNVDERGTWLVVKSYEVPAGVDPEKELVEKDLIREGRKYVARDILQKKKPGSTENREISKSVSITSESKKTQDILKLLEEKTFYSEGGFEGYLTLDQNSIQTEVSGKSSYSYPITEKKEFTGLARNDPSLIDKTYVKNGVTLNLSDVSWMSMGSTVSGDSIVSTYKAVATYTGKGYGSKVDGYIVTANYKGTVTKEIEGDYIYSIVYAPMEQEEPAVADKEDPKGGLLGFIGGNTEKDPEPSREDGAKETQNESITLGEQNRSSMNGFVVATVIVLVGIMIVGISLLVHRILEERNGEGETDEADYIDDVVPPIQKRSSTKPSAPKKPKKEKPAKKSRTRSRNTPKLSETYTGETGQETEEYSGLGTEEKTSLQMDYENANIGDDMNVYIQNDDVINIAVDDDPELSCLFKGN